MNLHGKSIIAGEPATALKAASTFRITSRIDSSPLDPEFTNATSDDVDRACRAAADAFEAYRTRTPEERATFLDKIADEISARAETLIARANAETALPTVRLTGEIGRTTGQLKMFAALLREGSWVEASIDTAQPDRKPLPKPDLRRMLVPLGPVAVFGASNFPFAFSTAGGDTASALAAGCPVVVKAHPAHPATSEMVAAAIIAAARATNMPAGVFSLLHGNGPEVGQQIVNHPAIKAVGFTGSLRAGRALYNAAAARPEPIPVYAEMGSTNPVFILPEAMRTRGAQIAEGLVTSVTLGVGQFCTNPGIAVALTEADLPAFTTTVAQKMTETAAGTMLYDALCTNYSAGIDRLRAIHGVEVITSTSATAPAPSQAKPGTAPATAFKTSAATFLQHEHLQEELFGPATVVVACNTPAEMLSIARALPGQLTCTIHGTDADLAAAGDLLLILQEKAGRLLINGFPTGVEVCPSMQHGGPYPATTDSRTTSVGTDAIKRFARPVCFQSFPDSLLPPELRNANDRGIWRLVDNQFTRDPVAPAATA